MFTLTTFPRLRLAVEELAKDRGFALAAQPALPDAWYAKAEAAEAELCLLSDEDVIVLATGDVDAELIEPAAQSAVLVLETAFAMPVGRCLFA